MGSGFKTFSAASVLTAADLNNYCQSQSVMYFATTTARDAAITSPVDGMVAYVGSNDSSEGLYSYNGTSWRKGPGWNAPWGNQLLVTNSTSNSTFTTTPTTISGMTGSVSVVNNRVYQCTFSCRFYNSTANNTSLFRIRQGGTVIFDSQHFSNSTSVDISAMVTVYFKATSTGALTFDVQGYSATGTLTVFHSNGPTTFAVNDVGPWGAPV
jgi:hypothetical protein